MLIGRTTSPTESTVATADAAASASSGSFSTTSSRSVRWGNSPACRPSSGPAIPSGPAEVIRRSGHQSRTKSASGSVTSMLLESKPAAKFTISTTYRHREPGFSTYQA